MEENSKQLLIRDICARLPYGVYVKFKQYNEPLCLSVKDALAIYNGGEIIDDLQYLYLRPMSSMTEEERKEINKSYSFSDFGNITIRYHMEGWWDNDTECSLKDYLYLINWLNEHHFDYRGLIEKGLALEAPKDMYKID